MSAPAGHPDVPQEIDIGTPSDGGESFAPANASVNASFEALRHFHDARRHSLFPVAPLNRKLSVFTPEALNDALREGDLVRQGHGRVGAVHHGVVDDGAAHDGDDITSEHGEVSRSPAIDKFEALRRQYGDGFGLAVTADEGSGDLGADETGMFPVGVPPYEAFPTGAFEPQPAHHVRRGHRSHHSKRSSSAHSNASSAMSPPGAKFSPIAFRLGSSRRNPASPINSAAALPGGPRGRPAHAAHGHGGTAGARTLYGGPVPPPPTEKAARSAGHARKATPINVVPGVGFSLKTGMREPYMGVSLPDEIMPADGGASSPEEVGSIPEMLRRASGAGLQHLGTLLSRIEHDDGHPSPNVGGRGHKTKTSIDWRKRLLALDMAGPIPENAGAAPEYTIALDRIVGAGAFEDEKGTAPSWDVASVPTLTHGEGWKVQGQNNDIKVDHAGSGIIHVGNPHRNESGRTRIRLAVAILTSFLSLVATVIYVALRISFTIQTVSEFGAHYTPACLFLVVEVVLSLSLALAAMHSVMTYKRNLTPRLRMRGEDHLPIIDLCILSGGHNDAVVMDTVAAALSLDYPSSRYRILVIDNGDSKDLQRRVEMFRQSRPMNLTFHKVVWDHSDRADADPRGNAIRFALSQRNGRGPGPFVAVLDGDMIPELSFLRALVPHIVNDPFVGMVSCPAAVYNLPQKLDQAVSTFVDATTGADLPRSGLLLRRSAMTDIGGFPAFSTVDDNAVKTLLAGKGYATVHLAEAVQCGTVPLSYADGIRHAQRLRAAPLHLAFRSGFFFGRRAAGLDALAKARRFASAFRPLFGIFVVFAMVVYPVTFGLGGILVAVSDVGQLNTLVQAAFAVILISRLHELVWCPPTKSLSTRRRLQAWAFMAPYDVLALFRSLDRRTRRDPPVEHHEREAHDPLHIRLFKTTVLNGAWVHLLLICAILATVGVSLHNTIEANLGGTYTLYQTGLAALLTVFWPTLYFFDILVGLAVPFAYACFPPTPAFREELILRDQYTAVARPRHDKRSLAPYRVRRATEIIVSTLLTSWSLALFFLTFIHVPHK